MGSGPDARPQGDGVMTMIEKNGLKIEPALYDFIVTEALPGSGIDEAAFFEGFAGLVADFAPKNRDLLAARDRLQEKLDAYHRENRSKPVDQAAYMTFLREIGYLLPSPRPTQVLTDNVDEEFATIAGPQLVVPMSNARYSLNAANARWGSLYDALYGTDAIREDGGAERGTGYNKVRGARVIAEAKAQLDLAAPLLRGKHADAIGYRVDAGRLVVSIAGAGDTGLVHADRFRRLSRHEQHAERHPARQQRPASGDRDRPRQPDRPHRSRRRDRHHGRIRDLRHHGHGGFGGGGRRGGQGAGLSQLARPDEGHVARGIRKERRHRPPHPGRRSRLQERQRRANSTCPAAA